jgi:hypothetical protein
MWASRLFQTHNCPPDLVKNNFALNTRCKDEIHKQKITAHRGVDKQGRMIIIH